MNKMPLLLLFSATLISCLAATAFEPMPVYQPPFKATAAVAADEKVQPVFDAKNKTFKFGSKEMVFADNGTFKVMSSGRCVAAGSFFMSTAFQSSQGNTSVTQLTPGGYKGGVLYVESCKVDEKAQSITVEGKLPFHKRNTPVQLGSWKQIATLTADGKVDITLDFTLPKGQSPSRTQGFTLKFPTATGYTYGAKSELATFSKSQKAICTFTGPALKPQYFNTGDNCAWEFPDKSINYLFWHRPSDNGIFFAPHNSKRNFFHVRFNPLMYGKAEKLPPGKVDFQTCDKLDIPARGKRNLFLNPYFGQKYNYYHATVDYYRGHADITSDEALFGKYSLKSFGHHGNLQPSPVPADPGDYTFSFYAKGQGTVQVMFFRAAFYPYDPRTTATFHVNTTTWKRFSYIYKHKVANVINPWIIVSPKGVENYGCNAKNPLYIDGLQLEAGTVATEFEAPAITAAFLSKEENFFESGKPVCGELEFSTLLPSVKGTAAISIKNFYDQNVKNLTIPFETGKGRYPTKKVQLGVLPDGIYVMTVDYTLASGEKSREHFRFSVMPYLNDNYPTRKIFSMKYQGGNMRYCTPEKCKGFYEGYYKRLWHIGCGARTQVSTLMPKAIADYEDKYHQLRIGSGIGPNLYGAPQMRKTFPELKDKIKDGELYFAFTDFYSYSDIRPILADFTLLNGWTKEYRNQFKKLIADQVRREPKWYCYGFASEWSQHIKARKEYPDMVKAFTEAVRSVYPDAKIMAMGETNMDARDGTLKLDTFFTQMKKEFPTWKPDFVESHPYVKDISKLYPNFLAFTKMADKHFGRPMLSFTEGGHFYPYAIPAWDLPLVGWSPPNWAAGTLSYDLGWSEKLSAAYYARYYLIFLTEYDRVVGACCSAENARNFQMDIAMTPRASQKIPNTLGVLFRNPQKYLGDFAPDKEIRCFAWIDGQGRPLAAIWSENPVMDAGQGQAVNAAFNYSNLELIDLMGVSHRAVNNTFQITPFPLFLRGRKGDSAAFIKALKDIRLSGSKNLPFQISDSITADGKMQLTFKNILPRPVNAKVTISGKSFDLNLPIHESRSLTVELPKKLSANQVQVMRLPIVCEVDGQKMTKTFESYVFACTRFNGDWNKVPVMKFPFPVRQFKLKEPEKCGYPGDFDAFFQVAWEPKGVHLRVTVTDDILNSSDLNRYRWDYDVCQVYFDTRCSARMYGRSNYDEDDYEYGLMPSADGKRCDVWRAVAVDMQLGLGTAAPLPNRMAKEIPATFTKTKNGYVYEAFFPAPYLLPAKMEKGWNMGFGMLVADRDHSKEPKQGLALNIKPDGSCYMSPQLWPLMIFTE